MSTPTYLYKLGLSHKDLLILRKYYQPLPIKQIAKEVGSTYNSIKTRIQKLRTKYSLPVRDNTHAQDISAFVADKDLVCSLYKEGVSIRQLAKRYGISHTTVATFFRDWGIIVTPKPNVGNPAKINIAGFYTDWHSITEQTIITVNRQPKFIVIPIE